MDEDAWTEGELKGTLGRLDEELEEARRRPNDRDARLSMRSSIRTLVEMKLPLGLGRDVDKLLVSPIAAAILLNKAIRRAECKLGDDQEEVAALSRSIERLRAALVPLGERLSDVEVPWIY